MKALVTGGAGLIGSHIVECLLRDGHEVRILDNLEPQTHPTGKPNWIWPEVEFIHGDVRDDQAVAQAVRQCDWVFHQAAFGGFTKEVSKYFDSNVMGTVVLMNAIREYAPSLVKCVVASSQAIYGEGRYFDPSSSQMTHPGIRSIGMLKRATWDFESETAGTYLVPVPTPEEHAPLGTTPYALSKLSQEKVALGLGAQFGIPTVALRYAVTYGPRQSLDNPYTGVMAIFAKRAKLGLPPIIYEDGLQTRDFIHAADQARANLFVAHHSSLAGVALNSGTGVGTNMRDFAEAISASLGGPRPILSGEFRLGDVRHFVHDSSLLRSLGFSPTLSFGQGLESFLEWFREQPLNADQFDAGRASLRSAGVLYGVGA